jgi:hypothetical protein
MKSVYLLSATLALVTTVGSVKAADLPDFSNLTQCLTHAGSEPNAITRCYALENCDKYNSDTDSGFQNCVNEANIAYQNSIQSRPTAQAASAVITSPSASDYEEKDPERKGGYMQRTEGAGR